MLNYNFINSEEELLNVIRARTAAYEDYKSVVANQNEELIKAFRQIQKPFLTGTEQEE